MVIGISDEFTTFAQHAAIKVCGVGGGGGNAVNRMIRSGLQEVEFIVVNTDAQALKNSAAPRRLQIGTSITTGLGAGAKPDVGRNAALEDRDRLAEALKGADMVFLTAGLGGGTGTGAAPVVAEIAASTGALTVAIVTLPFAFEGMERMENARNGLKELEQHVNSLIVVPNERVAALGQNKISFLNAFEQADEVLHNGVRAITDLITINGLVNVDFADVRTIMEVGGRALMGIGSAEGERRAVRAAEEAIVCPLLEQSNINGAMGVIVNVSGGRDIGMREMEEAVTTVRKAAHPRARIIFGAVVDEEDRPELQVMVIAAGFPAEASTSVTFFNDDFDERISTSPGYTPTTATTGDSDASTITEPPPAPTASAPGTPEKTIDPRKVSPGLAPGLQTDFVDDPVPDSPAEPNVSWSPDADFDRPTYQRNVKDKDEDSSALPAWLRRRIRK